MSSEQSTRLIGTPSSELEIDRSLVSGLLQDQHPDLSHFPLHLVDTGWDNAIFQLGDQFLVRLPRRHMAAALIEHEQRWLPKLPKLPLPIPLAYRLGQPSQRYPWRWSILPWLPGVAADQQEPDTHQAQRLAKFLRSLHVSAPPEAPSNPFRGVPLLQRAATVTERMQRLEQKTSLITPAIKQLWHQALSAPLDVEPTWIHGDLHARNVLVEQGVITGIIDWGDMTAGDRATDLAAIWMLFADQAARQYAFAEYSNVSEATWQRAIGWAIFFGVVLLDTGLVDCPRHQVMGETILRRVAEDY